MSWENFLQTPEGQGFLYAYQNLVAAAIALIAAILTYCASKYSANAVAERTKRALIDFCLHLDTDLRAELEFEKQNPKNINMHYFIHFGHRMQRHRPTLMTNENLIMLKGSDLAVALRIKGILEYLFLTFDRNSELCLALKDDPNNIWFENEYKRYCLVIEQVLSQTSWFAGTHTGLVNRIRYNFESSKD